MHKYLTPILFVLCACTDPITFDTSDNADLVVVDGFITSQNGPHKVSLSKSASFSGILEGGEEVPILGAEVWIRDDSGVHTSLSETEGGIYETPASFRGVSGRKYALHFRTVEGQEYQSIPELMPAADEITNAYFENTSIDVLSSDGRVLQRPGIEFYVDSQFESGNGFYRWDWEATYIKETTFYSPGNSRQFCYIDERALDHIIILNATEAGQSGVEKHPVQFFEIDIRFNFRYAMNILQYSMSEEAFEYWSRIENQRKRVGSIFDTAPSNPTGNIINLNDGNEVILGRFSVYGASSQRIYVAPENLPFMPDFVDLSCFPQSPMTPPPPYCSDCALFPGSRPDRPDFWVD